MKKKLLPLVLALGLVCSSCLGPDHAYTSIRNWNAGLSEKNWINEIVFIGLVIIPVYPLALTGDILLFNTLGYWTGNYVIGEPAPYPGFSRKKD